MKSTNIFLAIPYSLFSPSFYREVGGTWRAKGFVYLLLILVVYCLLWVLLLSHVVGRLEGGDADAYHTANADHYFFARGCFGEPKDADLYSMG